jgi:hypothetical protein
VDRADVEERQAHLPRGAGLGVDHQQRVAPGLPRHRGHLAVVHQGVVGLAKAPERPGEVGLAGQQPPGRPAAVVVEVPEPALVGDPGQRPIFGPLRLKRRDIGPAGGGAQVRQALRTEVGDVEPGGVPGHGREVPGDPGQPLAVGVDARIGDKIGVAVEHLAGLAGLA